MSAKRLMIAYVVLVLVALTAMLQSCQNQPAHAADAQAADQAWEAVYGGMSETELAKAVVLEPVGGVQ